MRREFLINILFLIFVNLLIKPFYIFGIDRTVQNTVGSEEYGIYFALFNFTFLFQIINDFGLHYFNNRNIAQNNHLLTKYFPNIFLLKLILGGVYIVVVFSIAYLSGYELPYFHLIFFMAVNHFFLSFILFLRSNISGLALYRTDSFISVLDRMLLIIVCGILLWAPPFRGAFRIEWFVYAQTSTLLITSTVTFFLVRKNIQHFKIKLRTAFLLVILKKSYPYALAVFLMTAYSRIDAVMLERMLSDGKNEAGIYAMAYRLLDACNMFGFLFSGLLLPMFARLIKNGKSITSLLRTSFQFIWVGAITLSAATYFFQEEIMLLLYTEADAYAGQILGLLILSFIAVSGIYIFGPLLTANGSIRKMNHIFIAGLVLNIGLNIVLIPSYKALGAAMATCVTQFLVFFLEMWLSKKELDLSINYSLLFRLLLYSFLIIITSYTLYYLLDVNWIFRFLLALFLGIALALPFRFFKLKLFFERGV